MLSSVLPEPFLDEDQELTTVHTNVHCLLRSHGIIDELTQDESLDHLPVPSIHDYALLPLTYLQL